LHFQPFHPGRLVGKCTVQLRLERCVEHGFEARAGCEPERDQVPAEHERAGPGVFQLQRGGAAAEIVDASQHLGRVKRRAAIVVCAHDDAELVEGGRQEFAGEAPHAGIGDVGRAVMMGEMVHDEGPHALADLTRRTDAVEEVFCQRPARRFVAGTNPAQLAAPLAERGGGRFAEVVGEHGEKEHAPAKGISALPGVETHDGVAAVRRVREHVAFGVPLGILLRAAQSGDFREVFQPAGLLKDIEAAGRLADLLGPFGPFAPDAFDGELGVGVFDRAAKRGGFGRDDKVETRGELESAEHAQRVFDKRAAGVAQDAGA
jgi:hypothetical protein